MNSRPREPQGVEVASDSESQSLPIVVWIFGDFGGHAPLGPLAERRLLRVASVGEAMAGIRPVARVRALDLSAEDDSLVDLSVSFSDLRDFDENQLRETVPPLRRIWGRRERHAEPAPMEVDPPAQGAMDVAIREALRAASSGAGRPRQERGSQVFGERGAQSGDRYRRQLELIRGQEQFKSLESAWRGLGRILSLSGPLQIACSLLPIEDGELRRQLRRLDGSGRSDLELVLDAACSDPRERPELVMVEASFEPDPDGIASLRGLSALAAHAAAPVIASISRSFLGYDGGVEDSRSAQVSIPARFRQVDFAGFRSLREDPRAGLLGLAGPPVRRTLDASEPLEGERLGWSQSGASAFFESLLVDRTGGRPPALTANGRPGARGAAEVEGAGAVAEAFADAGVIFTGETAVDGTDSPGFSASSVFAPTVYPAVPRQAGQAEGSYRWLADVRARRLAARLAKLATLEARGAGMPERSPGALGDFGDRIRATLRSDLHGPGPPGLVPGSCTCSVRAFYPGIDERSLSIEVTVSFASGDGRGGSMRFICYPFQ